MKNINQSFTATALYVFSVAFASAYAGLLNISPVPLELTPAVAPNILIVTDDSGSMDWEVLTQDINSSGALVGPNMDGGGDFFTLVPRNFVLDSGGTTAPCTFYVNPATDTPNGDFAGGYLYGVYFPSNDAKPNDTNIPANNDVNQACFVASDEEWRFRFYKFNSLYFDPNKTYEPWAGLNKIGTPYIDLANDITAVPDNPYDPDINNLLDLTDDSPGIDENGNRITGEGFRYYTWNVNSDDGNSNGVFDEGEQQLNFIKDKDANTKQNFANWFIYYRKRSYVAKAIISHAVANNSSARVGHSTLNQNVTSSNVPLVELNASLLSGSKRDLLDAIGATSSSGNTPLRQVYENVGEYFSCEANSLFGGLSSSSPGDDDCPYVAAPAGSCQVSSTFLLTDGFGNGSAPSIVTSDEDSGGLTSSNFDGGAFADDPLNLPAEITLADIAMFYFENDLQNLDDDVPVTSVDMARYPESSPLLNADDRLGQHLNTNVLSIFNSTEVATANLEPSGAKTPFAWQPPGDFAGQVDDLKHAAYNGRGEYVAIDFVTDVAEPENYFSNLFSEVDDAFSTAATTPGSTTAIAFNTQSIAQDSLAFRTFSNLATNSGDLVAQVVEADGTLKFDPVTNKPEFLWSAAQELPAEASRLILTYDDATASGKLFLSDSTSGLTMAQETILSDPTPTNVSAEEIVDRRVDYLRGDSSNEGVNFADGEMRMRVPVDFLNAEGINTGGKIGDIVHSSPVFVGQPPFASRFGGEYPSAAVDSYFAYRNSNSNRDGLVLVGANDGMLHAFDADTGVEKFAYVPNALLADISEYTKPEYNHQFYVDATPSVNDVFIDPRSVSGSTLEWRTVLVNGLGAGGKGYFALDITDPNNIDENSVMWEFTDTNDDNLGFTYSRPILAMSNNVASGQQRWVAIFGNGFNNENPDGNASVYILFLDAGYDGWSSGDFIEIDTFVGKDADGTPNGIGGVTGIDENGDGTVDRLYAGDLQGNVFVFDISDPDTTNWVLEKTLFQAKYTADINEPIQPITSRPTVVANPDGGGGYLVVVGTGSYFTNEDATSTDIQSIYGLWDNPDSTNDSTIAHSSSASELVEQEFTTSVTTVNRDGNDVDLEVRTVSSNVVAYNDEALDPATHVRGWYIDFDIAPPSGTGIQFPGERPVRNLQLRNNQLFFSTVIPQDGTSCDPSAGGFGLSVNPLSGSVEDVIFDINIDGEFDLDDKILINSISTVISGTRFESAPSDSTFIGDYRLTQLSDTSVDRILVNPNLNDGGGLGALLGRHSWKEIRQ